MTFERHCRNFLKLGLASALIWCLLIWGIHHALAQISGGVTTSGTVTAGHTAVFKSRSQIEDGGIPSGLIPATSNMTFAFATTGSDANPCTTGSPCLTPQHVVNLANSYDWNNLYFPTINGADGSYLNANTILPALFNCPNGGVIIGNTTTPTNVELTDNGSAYVFNQDSYAQWTINGVSLAGTFGGVFLNPHAILNWNHINFAGTFSQWVLSQQPYSSAFGGNYQSLGGSFTVSSASMNGLVFSRGLTNFDLSTIVFNNAITVNTLMAFDAVLGFAAFDGVIVTNGGNVTASTNGLNMANGAFFESDNNAKVDGVVLSRANFPGGKVVVDGWSTFAADLFVAYQTSSVAAIADTDGILRADYGYTAAGQWSFNTVSGILSIISPNINGTYFTQANNSVGGHTITIGTIGQAGNFNLPVGAGGVFDITTGNIPYWWDASANFNVWGTLGWGPSSNGTFSVPIIDTGISRNSAGIVDVNNGTPGSNAGQIKVAGLISKGSAPVGTTGSCSASGFVGGTLAGKFTAPLCAAGTIILSALPAAPNGYTCNAQDQTTPADTLKQTANSVSSSTFAATTALNDVIAFQCTGW